MFQVENRGISMAKNHDLTQTNGPEEITPEWLYMSRRQFFKLVGLVGIGAALAACAPKMTTTAPGSGSTPQAGTANPVLTLPPGGQGLGPDDALTPYDVVTNYNNFYEFTEDKEGVARLAKDFNPQPYSLKVYGMVKNPLTLSLDDILSKFKQEERVYRLRCVEGWSMVIPWSGFQLSSLLQEVEPTAEAKFVRFETLIDQKQFPNQNSGFYPWPYQEGLRLDEAMNELAILATGLYGKPLPAQDGAPLRLVVPWKYGFKSIKTIIKIELVDKPPSTMWSTIAPNEYGFYANVNPTVPHPRWSQASEQRIGVPGRRATLMFNGYEAQVAQLYKDMDLRVNY
jgi:sulfoxide reductase catalytic subunit YedY